MNKQLILRNFLLGMITTITTVMVGCSKDEIGQDGVNDVFDSKANSSETFVIGQKLDNAYSVANMKAAYDSLKSIGMIKNPISISTTHRYIQLLPKDSADMNAIIEDTSLVLFPYPLDYEIKGEGSFELQEGEEAKIYTVVPADYKVPIDYKLLEECYIPDDTEDNDLINLEIASLLRTGNVTQEEVENLKNSKARRVRPEGYVKVYDTYYNDYKPVKGVKVYTRRLVNISTTYTDNNGRYSMGSKYLFNPIYALLFENKDGFKIYGNIFILTSAVHNVGTRSKNGYNFNIGFGSKAWPWATINNAALYYRKTLVPHFGIGNTPRDMRFWYMDRESSLGSGCAPMIRHIAGYTSASLSLLLTTFGVSVSSSVAVGSLLYCVMSVCPDIFIFNNRATSTYSLNRLVYHEMSHASHYMKVGSAYWLNYITQTVAHKGYGSEPDFANGIVGVGEMWAYYFETKSKNYVYDETYMYDYEYWFKPQILYEINEEIPTIGPAQIFQTLSSNIDNHGDLKFALISRYGYSDIITRIFTNNGF